LSGFDSVTPVDLNLDFFAGILSGEKKLGHCVVYYETEMQFYFLDPVDQLYKITSPEKLQHLIRALLMKCAQEMPREIQLLNLFHEFRSEKFTRQILQRAKSILAADESFFSPESKNQRKAGPEIPERLARVFVESMLEKREGSILTVTQAYALFSHLSLENHLNPIKRATFRQMMSELMKGTFGLSLRRDVKDERGKNQEGWKGIGTLAAEAPTQTATT
jgi:hypothetical protein